MKLKDLNVGQIIRNGPSYYQANYILDEALVSWLTFQTGFHVRDLVALYLLRL